MKTLKETCKSHSSQLGCCQSALTRASLCSLCSWTHHVTATITCSLLSPCGSSAHSPEPGRALRSCNTSILPVGGASETMTTGPHCSALSCHSGNPCPVLLSACFSLLTRCIMKNFWNSLWNFMVFGQRDVPPEAFMKNTSSCRSCFRQCKDTQIMVC